MSTLQLGMVCLTAIVLATILFGDRQAREEHASVFDDLKVGDRVAAYTEGGQSVVGVVSSSPNGRLLLSDAELVTGGQKERLGNVRIPGRSVELVQVISRVERPRDPTNVS